MGTEEKTDYRKSTPEVLYQMRKTVIALFKKQKSAEEIIEVTDFSKRTVRETIRKYKSGGMAALKPKKRGRKAGEKRTLTPNQEKEVVRAITDKNPDQLKMKCALWTRDAVRQLIKRAPVFVINSIVDFTSGSIVGSGVGKKASTTPMTIFNQKKAIAVFCKTSD